MFTSLNRVVTAIDGKSKRRWRRSQLLQGRPGPSWPPRSALADHRLL